MAASKTAPVLPWMRVPITIQAGTGVPLDAVGRLDPRLKQALLGGLRLDCAAGINLSSACKTELVDGGVKQQQFCVTHGLKHNFKLMT